MGSPNTAIFLINLLPQKSFFKASKGSLKGEAPQKHLKKINEVLGKIFYPINVTLEIPEIQNIPN